MDDNKEAPKELEFISSRYKVIFTKLTATKKATKRHISSAKATALPALPTAAVPPAATAQAATSTDGPQVKKSNTDLTKVDAPETWTFADLKPETDALSFNISKVSSDKWGHLHITQQAKYLSYTIPPQKIQDTVKQCQSRALVSLKTQREINRQHQHQKHITLLRKRDQYTSPTDEQAALQGIAMAKQRREWKTKVDKAVRETEIQMLIEGQKSSIDAIRLKEFLADAPSHHIDDSFISPPDKQRIRKLLTEL